MARTITDPLTLAVTKATTWTVPRTTFEPIVGVRLDNPNKPGEPDEDVYVVAIEGKFRTLHPSPPSAILPETMSMVISVVSVATGKVVLTGVYPEGYPLSLTALGPGTDVPVPRSK